ncbi:Crossover junction endodeoxyribonuclease RuvC [compost metagenome]
MTNKYRVIGVDISKSSTGWSIVDYDNGNLKLIDYGYIPTNKLTHSESLVLIEKRISQIVEKYQPNFASIEQMFVGKNAGTGMTLANAHGVVLLVLAKNKIPYNYYSVMTLKSRVLGGVKTKKDDGTKKTGDEMKAEVSRKIIEVFGASSFIKEYNNDVTDSISAAYTFILMDGKEIEKAKKVRKKKTT